MGRCLMYYIDFGECRTWLKKKDLGLRKNNYYIIVNYLKSILINYVIQNKTDINYIVLVRYDHH